MPYRALLPVFVLALANFALYTGVGQGSLAVVSKQLVSQYGWSRGDVGLIGTLMLLTPVAVAYLVGVISDRRGPRGVIVFGSVAATVGFLMASSSKTLAAFYAYAIVIGLAQASLGLITGAALVRGALALHAGLALAVATMGISLGGIVGPPTMQALIGSRGLGSAFIILAVVNAAVIPLLLLRLPRMGPGLSPSRPVNEGRRYLRTRTFWALAVINTGMLYAVYAISQHWVLLFTDIGGDPGDAAKALTLYYVSGLVGRFVIGPLYDRFSIFKTGRAVLALMALFVIALTLLRSSLLMLGVYAVGFGFLYGSFLLMGPVFVSRCFAPGKSGQILGSLVMVWGLLSALSPYVTGALHDLTGNYGSAFALASVMATLSAVAVWFVRVEDQSETAGR